MNEQFWLSCADPLRLLADLYPMRSHNSTQPQSRQSRLYLLACARKQWAHLPTVFRAMVWLGEVYADEPREYRSIYNAVTPLTERLMGVSVTWGDVQSAQLDLLAAEAAVPELANAWRTAMAPTAPAASPHPIDLNGVARLIHLAFERMTPPYQWVPPDLHDVNLLRDVFGNPCRRVAFADAWRTADVTAFAQSMYDRREFSGMPIFADALQEAGCNDLDILGHCRSGGPHARGCWVLDPLLRTN